MRWMWLAIALTVVLALPAYPQTKWYWPDGTEWRPNDIYCGKVHLHSDFSDGDRTPQMLKDAVRATGGRVYFIYDHYEQIGNAKKWSGVLGDYGYDKYLQTFSGGDPIGIAGTEIMFGKSHLLVFGARDKMKEFFSRDLTGKTQQDVLDIAVELELLTVAAHPFSKQFPFDRTQVRGLSGVEIFNDENYAKTRDWVLELEKSGHDIFVMAGCDSHTSVDPTKYDRRRWDRNTWFSCIPEPQYILAYLRRGASYVSCDGLTVSRGCFPLYDNRWFKYSTRDKFSYHLGFSFSPALKAAKKVRLYLDGTAMTESEQTIAKGATNFVYDFHSNRHFQGEKHWFLLEVEGMFLSSPFKYDFTEAR